ncbi:MAG TPA: hypothetical protein ENI87_04220 [bacterium]|nr:hypothetical protein [bacterium]
MTKRPIRLAALPLLLFGACSIPQTITLLGEASPPPAHGRPGWVNVCADVGGWAGGLVGGIGSLVLLPVTYPISLLADEGMSDAAADEFLFWPATTLAGAGHAALGWPADMLDWTFRRAWTAPDDPVTPYDRTPELTPFARPRADGERP